MSALKRRNILRCKEKAESESTPNGEEESKKHRGWMSRKTEIFNAIVTLCGLYLFYMILSLQKGKEFIRSFCVKIMRSPCFDCEVTLYPFVMNSRSLRLRWHKTDG